jgi:hypothetical protein
MDWVLSTIIFIIVLFVYIHVANHVSTSSDLEVYDVLNIPSDKLEDLCGSKQPFIAKNNNNPLHGSIHGALSKVCNFSIRTTGSHIENDIPPLTVGRDKAEKLFSGNDDSEVKYYSCGNWIESKDSLDTPGLSVERDAFFAPPMTVFSKSDFFVGETGAHSALRHEIAHRTFLYGFNNASSVILVPPDRYNDLNVIKDYELLEFRSPKNPWNDDEVKGSIKIILEPGDTLYIPPYWFYSIKLNEHSKVHLFQYYTALNLVSTVNHHVIHMLQMNNIKMKYDSKKTINFGTSDEKKEDIPKKKKKVIFKKEEDPVETKKEPINENN